MNKSGRNKIKQRSAVSRKLLMQYVISIIGYVVGVMLFVFVAWRFCMMFIWQPDDPLYILLQTVKEYIILFLGITFLIGWVFITYYFISKPLRYLDEVVVATEQLVVPSDEPIVLPNEMFYAENELNRVREKALDNARTVKEAEQRKNDLVMYLAHDLKTPLSSVIGYLTLLRDEQQISAELRERYLSISLEKAESGFDMKYQRNKVHNLKLAATTIDKIAIKPNETFSFWQLVRWADRQEKYKDGLNFVNGKIVGSYGGGLCQLSNMLFWLFLHTPLTVIERHGHAVESFPSTTEELPCGTDATINEGWLDLKICNDTDNTFQVVVEFDDEYMYGSILSQNSVNMEYKVYNSSVSYVRENGKVYQIASVCRTEKDITTGKDSQKELYINRCEIGYELDGEIEIEERGANDD